MSTRFLTTSIEDLSSGKQDKIGEGGLQISSIDQLQEELDGKQATITDGSLTIARTNGLQTALNSKQATITDNSLTIARTNGLQAALNSKASLANTPTFSEGLYTKTSNANSSGYVRFYDDNNSNFVDLHCASTVQYNHNINLPTNSIDTSDITLLSDQDIIPVNKGGSGQTTYTDGDLLIGRSSGNTLVKSKLTQAGSVSITNGDGSITISGTDTTYTAGTNVSISAANQISSTDTTYTAGTNVNISAANQISSTDTTYSAGTNISINASNQISLATTALSNVALNSFTANGKQITCPSAQGTLALTSDLSNLISSSDAAQLIKNSTEALTIVGNESFKKIGNSSLPLLIQSSKISTDMNGQMIFDVANSSPLILRNTAGSNNADLTVELNNGYAAIRNTQSGNLSLITGSETALTINNVNQAVGVGSGIFNTYQPATAFEVRADSSQSANATATVQVTSQNASCEPSLQLVNTANSKTSTIKMKTSGAVSVSTEVHIPDENIIIGGGNSVVNRALVVNHAPGSSDGADYIVFKFNNNQPFGNGNYAGIAQTNSGGGVAFNSASDYRLKKNIQPCGSVLDGIGNLNVVTYHYKTESNDAERSIGFIAHEVQERFPALDYVVSGTKDDENRFQQIDYGKLTPVSIKAIQELTSLVRNLQERIDVLEAKNNV